MSKTGSHELLVDADGTYEILFPKRYTSRVRLLFVEDNRSFTGRFTNGEPLFIAFQNSYSHTSDLAGVNFLFLCVSYD